MIKFSLIADKLQYPPSIKGKLSSLHSDVIAYVSNNYDGTASYRQKAINIINTLSYILVNEDSMPMDYDPADPFKLPTVDDDISKPVLGKLYIQSRLVDWDIEPKYQSESSVDTMQNINISKHAESLPYNIATKPTPKDDLYLKPPSFPQFDYNKPYMQRMIGPDMYTIYTSLPEVPTKQNEISVTTDISKMTYQDFMQLYPNHLIHTRSAGLYEKIPDIDYDDKLGLILPISGFTKSELIDNIIQYPHIFRLFKYIDDEIVSFYTTIEIDGQLFKTLDVWDTLPESSVIPKSSDFIKEYVIRRYLLERDVKHINHKFPIYGTFDKFLTLFQPADDYISMGYSDVVNIAKQCVKSRVAYKQSRNPVLRRLLNE